MRAELRRGQKKKKKEYSQAKGLQPLKALNNDFAAN